MPDDAPELIIGLGNPGPEHERDRHNAGFWLVDELSAGAGFRSEPKLLSDTCQLQLGGRTLRLVKPATFMNRSGQAMRRAMDYYRVDPERVLVVHDELDLPPGCARLKMGGGHGGHNGLRDIISHCGRDFLRLRIGIGHPGRREQVTGYVLKPPHADDRRRIEDAILESRRAIDVLLADGLQKAMSRLHTATPHEKLPDSPGPAG